VRSVISAGLPLQLGSRPTRVQRRVFTHPAANTGTVELRQIPTTISSGRMLRRPTRLCVYADGCDTDMLRSSTIAFDPGRDTQLRSVLSPATWRKRHGRFSRRKNRTASRYGKKKLFRLRTGKRECVMGASTPAMLNATPVRDIIMLAWTAKI